MNSQNSKGKNEPAECAMHDPSSGSRFLGRTYPRSESISSGDSAIYGRGLMDTRRMFVPILFVIAS
jgi:hypothetical protein